METVADLLDAPGAQSQTVDELLDDKPARISPAVTPEAIAMEANGGQIGNIMEPEGHKPLPAIGPDGYLHESHPYAWARIRQTPFMRKILGPTSDEQAAIANGTLAGPPGGDPGIVPILTRAPLPFAIPNQMAQRVLLGYFVARNVADQPERIAAISDKFKNGDDKGAWHDILGDTLDTGMAALAAKGLHESFNTPKLTVGAPNEPTTSTGAPDYDAMLKQEIANQRAKGMTPEFRVLFGGISPEVAGTTPEKVSAYAKSLGREYTPVATPTEVAPTEAPAPAEPAQPQEPAPVETVDTVLDGKIVQPAPPPPKPTEPAPAPVAVEPAITDTRTPEQKVPGPNYVWNPANPLDEDLTAPAATPEPAKAASAAPPAQPPEEEATFGASKLPLGVSKSQWDEMAKLSDNEQVKKYGTSRARLIEKATLAQPLPPEPTKAKGKQRKAKPVEKPAEAAAKVQDHVQEVAQAEGQRPAKEVKSELVQRVESEITKLGDEPALLFSDPVKSRGKREFYVYSPDKALRIRVRESIGTNWSLEHEKTNGKTGALETKSVGTASGDIREATRAAGSAMEQLMNPKAGTVTVKIPGDGTFTIARTHWALNNILDKARALDTRSTGKLPYRKMASDTFQPGDLSFTEEEWMDPATIAKLEAAIKNPKTSVENRRVYLTALEQAKGLQGITDPVPENPVLQETVKGVSSMYGVTPEQVQQVLKDEGQYPLFGPSPSSPSGAGRPGPPASRTKAEQARAALSTLSAEELSKALEIESKVSSIDPKKAPTGIPQYNVNGTVIKSAADFARTLLPLRSPYAESLKIAIVDDAGKVVHSQVMYAGTVDSTNWDGRDLMRLHATHGHLGNKILISHNHPSGDPTPSAADWKVHGAMTNLAHAAGFKIVDHVITNGHRFYSMGTNELRQFETPNVAEWENMPRGELRPLTTTEGFNALVNTLRQTNPNVTHIIYANTRGGVTAIERVEPNLEKIWPALWRGIGLEGARNVAIDFGPMVNRADAHHWAGQVNRMLSSTTTRVMDFSCNGVISGQQEGLMQGGIMFDAPRAEGGKSSPKLQRYPGQPDEPPTALEMKEGNAFLQDINRLRGNVAPQTIGPDARYVGNLMRMLNAKMANEMLRADEALKQFRNDFDRTPLPKNWQYDPRLPLPRNLAFIDAYESGTQGAMTPLEQGGGENVQGAK
jgi:DNA repair protein RadC